MGFLWWRRQDLPPEVQDYNTWTRDENRRQVILLANDVKDAQAKAILLEVQHIHGVKELRRVMAEGLPIAPQQAVVDDIAQRLRNAQARVQEMRMHARFLYRDYFRQ